ncbi:hypothetical protein QYE76_057367 [Lolium multiflorum]|uniref:Clp R domain-containing protein n=1 Tax=Lolium multiflorum TaxID=4521 RepID=A0AAD8T3G5_LOLMU|nr:hypothetical protein QYE76_057367 [Lolium multiflorum]
MRVTVREEAMGEEAAGVVQQAVCLARSRGHAQVTPLHIASAMLSVSAAGVLRAACLRSQSHLLQLNELDLCLDVALDRLAYAPIHMPRGNDGGWHVGPVPSNAFVAALKRALAHGRRRGDVDGGKVELKDLAVSVLDDPTVDRVVSTAGFSSSQLGAVISSEESCRASCGITTLPARVSIKIRAGQPSIQTVPELHWSVVADVPSRSGNQASQPNSGATRTGFFDGAELGGTAAILPPWLRRYQDIIPTGATIAGTRILPVDAVRRRAKFTELTAQNMKILCDALELRCPRHGDIVPGISSTVLLCRSGLTRRMSLRKQQPTSSSSSPTTTWLLFRGRDAGGKTAIALELAKLIFGSYGKFTAVQAASSDKPTHNGKLTLKRQRSPGDGNGDYAGPRLFKAIRENPHRVILIEGVDRLDHDSEMRIKDAIVAGTLSGCNGDVVGLEDAIVVLCSDVLESGSMVSSPPVKPRSRNNVQDREEGSDMGKKVRSRRRRLSLDLNVCADGEEEEEGVPAEDSAILDVVDGVFHFH